MSFKERLLDWMAHSWLPRLLGSVNLYRYFHIWQQQGFHVLKAHYSSLVPDTRQLPDELWERPFSLAGLEMNDGEELRFLREMVPRYRDETDCLPRAPDPTSIILITPFSSATTR